MKSLNLLKALIDLFLFFSVLGGLTVLIIVPMKLISPDFEIPITIKGVAVTGSDWFSLAVILLAGIGAFFFIYAIFLIRKILILFLRREIFSDTVVGYFKLGGKCIIVSALLTSVPMFFYNMVQRNHLGIDFMGGGFDSLLLSVSLGLLFIVIGEIFQHAKKMKEENELTV